MNENRQDSAPERGVVKRVREDGLEGEGSRRVVPLKHGEPVEAGLGLAYYNSLRALFENEPELFESLLAIAQDRIRDAAPAHIARLRQALFLRHGDGTLDPMMRDVLLSACQVTPEGPVLVSPFRPESPDDVRAVEEADRRALDRLRRLSRPDDDDTRKGGGRGRG